MADRMTDEPEADQSPAPGTRLSVAGYARFRRARGLPGGSRWNVQKALRDGRIVKEPDGTIDPDRADRDWLANTAVQKRREVAPASYQEARAIREALNARLAKLDYEERLRQLVPAAEVKQEAFEMARTFRDRMLAIPGRIAASLAAEDDVKRVEAKLAFEIRRALEELSV
jgi:hypothetical protein